MNCAELITKSITESGMSVNKIADVCNSENEELELSQRYLRMIKSDETCRPDHKYLRAIAKACGKHEDLFVIQKYFDNAPEAFHELMNELKEYSTVASIEALKYTQNTDLLETAKKAVQDMTESEFLIAYVEETKANLKLVSCGEDSNGIPMLKIQAEEIPGIEVVDDAMSPCIPKGSKIKVKPLDASEYKDDDMLCYIRNDTRVLNVRKAIFQNDERTKVKMISSNDYLSETFALSEITILGKAMQVIIDL